MEAADGCETEKWHDQVCLLGKPSTNIVTPGATRETGSMQLGHSLDAGVCVEVTGYGGESRRLPGFWLLAAASV